MSEPKPGERPEGADEELPHEEPAPPEAHAQQQRQVAEPPPEQRVRIGNPHELPPHQAVWGQTGDPLEMKRAMRRGRYKLAVTSTFALTIVFLELLWLAPGVGIAFGVLMAPLMVYLIRVTRTYLDDESSFRRGMANTGSIIVTILGSLLFMFVSFATIFWIICGRS